MSLRMIGWEDAPPKGDAADFRGSDDELEELVRRAPAYTPREMRRSDRVATVPTEALLTSRPTADGPSRSSSSSRSLNRSHGGMYIAVGAASAGFAVALV